jgi:RNA polymerase sigma factor (sigma-70 family)
MKDKSREIAAAYHPDFLFWINEYFVNKNRNDEILEKIYTTMGRVLINRFQNMLTTNVITAEDIYNETWFSILDPLTPDYDPKKGSFIGYFIFIAKNNIRNWNFKIENKKVIQLDDIKNEIIDKLEPNKELFNKELKIEFYKEVNKLSDYQREIIIFRKLGFRFSEIAKIFDTTEDSLRQRMLSAKKNLLNNEAIKELISILEEKC